MNPIVITFIVTIISIGIAFIIIKYKLLDLLENQESESIKTNYIVGETYSGIIYYGPLRNTVIKGKLLSFKEKTNHALIKDEKEYIYAVDLDSLRLDSFNKNTK